MRLRIGLGRYVNAVDELAVLRPEPARLDRPSGSLNGSSNMTRRYQTSQTEAQTMPCQQTLFDDLASISADK